MREFNTTLDDCIIVNVKNFHGNDICVYIDQELAAMSKLGYVGYILAEVGTFLDANDK